MRRTTCFIHTENPNNSDKEALCTRCADKHPFHSVSSRLRVPRKRRSVPAGSFSSVQTKMGVEVRGLIEAFAAHVAAKGLLPGVDSMVSLEHADRGEALPAHGAAIRLLLGVPTHVDLQLAGEAEALPALFTAVPPLDARVRVTGRGRLEGFHVL